MDLPDVVYLCGPAVGDELRYSLRSVAAHLPHDRVWIVGHQPRWVRQVEQIPVPQPAGQKWSNQEANLRAYCQQRDGTDRFLLFNDDFFVMRPLGQVPVWHRGPIGDLVGTYRQRRDEFVQRLRNTAAHVGLDAPSYDSIHTPMLLDKGRLLDVLDSMPAKTLFRTVYGNRYQIGGTVHGDVKVKTNQPAHAGALLSTDDSGFLRGPAGKMIRARFPRRSPYE